MMAVDRLNEVIEAGRVEALSRPFLEARGPEMLHFLNRGQGLVIERLDALLGEECPRSSARFSRKGSMNIETCQRLTGFLE